MKRHVFRISTARSLPISASIAPPQTIWGILAQKWGLKEF